MSNIFLPPDLIKSNSWIQSFDKYKDLYKRSLESPNEFWEQFALQYYWKELPKFNAVWNFDINKGPINIKWFDGGLTNISYNLLDANIIKGLGDQPAFIWVPNDPSENHAQITYKELLREVCKFCHVLKHKGVKKGDRVCLYMPMVIQLPIAMLACSRIGAIHSVIFAGYSAESVEERIKDANINIIITADGYYRGDKLITLKPIVDQAIQFSSNDGIDIKSCIVVRHVTPSKNNSVANETHSSPNRMKSQKLISLVEKPSNHESCHRPIQNYKIPWNDRIDSWWDDEMSKITQNSENDFYFEPEWLDPEAPLFMLYTSGSTGTPKGVLHTCIGYLMYAAATFKYVFDYHPGDVYFCSADIGWITGHSYVVYGPLANGAISIIFEGIPTFPEPDRYWQIIEEFKVNQFYTSPTAIRALMKFGTDIVKKHDLSSLSILGTVGEPINPEAWLWYYKVVGRGKCVVVDTYWQTETGGHVLTPLPGAMPTKPGSAALPFFGVEPVILDENGHEVEDGKDGFLCFKRPWPGIMRTVYNCQERFEKGYFTKFPGYYTTGDGAHRDSDGYYWIGGRVDDMMNVSGHLLSTAAVESALIHRSRTCDSKQDNNDIPVAEAAVVSIPHPIKGECLYCFVTLKNGYSFTDELVKELKETIAEKIGRFAIPDYIQNAPLLPKTRSGKIMRRILRAIAQGSGKDKLGDISTLADESVIDQLISNRVGENP
ncbi:unnamed protein product [Gordionus sp. m RMFG-2023]|uniref:acetyl-coenzyme A synthetase-like isoform X2 n=1 Tax=Gordionus sp. m RMFG-2023 TaxID=3053472 RepID=UPI0030E2BFAA